MATVLQRVCSVLGGFRRLMNGKQGRKLVPNGVGGDVYPNEPDTTKYLEGGLESTSPGTTEHLYSESITLTGDGVHLFDVDWLQGRLVLDPADYAQGGAATKLRGLVVIQSGVISPGTSVIVDLERFTAIGVDGNPTIASTLAVFNFPDVVQREYRRSVSAEFDPPPITNGMAFVVSSSGAVANGAIVIVTAILQLLHVPV